MVRNMKTNFNEPLNGELFVWKTALNETFVLKMKDNSKTPYEMEVVSYEGRDAVSFRPGSRFVATMRYGEWTLVVDPSKQTMEVT